MKVEKGCRYESKYLIKQISSLVTVTIGMWAGGYYLLCYYILFCTKPTYLTARVWPFSIDFNDNNFGCGTKKCMRAGDRKLLYYKSWPNYEGLIHPQCYTLIVLIRKYAQSCYVYATVLVRCIGFPIYPMYVRNTFTLRKLLFGCYCTLHGILFFNHFKLVLHLKVY